jgi:hypothetical protein
MTSNPIVGSVYRGLKGQLFWLETVETRPGDVPRAVVHLIGEGTVRFPLEDFAKWFPDDPLDHPLAPRDEA